MTLVNLAAGGLLLAQAAAGPAAPSGSTALVGGDGPRLHVRRLGTQGPALLAPGHVFLAEALAPLAGRHRLILYDMRGRGRSEPVPQPERLGLDRDVEDLERVRKAEGLDRVSLVGFSYLGVVVALYAAQHPALVERVVQMGPMAPRSATVLAGRRPGPSAEALARLEALRRDALPERDPEAFCRAWWEAQLPLFAGSLPAPAVWRTLTAGCALPNEQPDRFLATIGGVFARFQSWDYADVARTVKAPTLVVHGTADQAATIEGGREWATLIPDARLLELAGAGHAVFAERPDEVLPAIEAFLDGRWPPTSRRPGTNER